MGLILIHTSVIQNSRGRGHSLSPMSPLEQSSYSHTPPPSLGEIPSLEESGLLCCCPLRPSQAPRTDFPTHLQSEEPGGLGGP